MRLVTDDSRMLAYKAWRESRVRFEELIFPDEIHDFLMWKSWIRAYAATNEFFGRKLK